MLHQYPLDDERFHDIAQRARLAVAELCPPWNDLNTHDPGVTLLELFAWLTELQRFHLDRSEDAGAFFPLLGARRRRARPAEVDITIPAGHPPCHIPAGTPLYAEDIRFETTADAYYGGDGLQLHIIQRESVPPRLLGEARGGYPHAVFRIDTRGLAIVHESMRVTVDSERWALVDDFRAAQPDERCCALDCETGELTFGDGVRGAMPCGNVAVEAMALTRGAGGNIAPGRITGVETSAGALPVRQPEAAYGGAARESVAQALTRMLASQRQAVTAADIEQLVRETPGVRTGRVRAFAEGTAPAAGAPRTVTVAVQPLDGATLGDDEKRHIKAHLEPYRLVCHNFAIVAPETVRVDISLELRALPRGAGFATGLERDVRLWFDKHCGGFGAKIRPAQIQAFLNARPEVREVTRCTLRATGNARTDVDGDITLPPGALAELGEVALRIVDAVY